MYRLVFYLQEVNNKEKKIDFNLIGMDGRFAQYQNEKNFSFVQNTFPSYRKGKENT